jgi:hypothetical protein
VCELSRQPDLTGNHEDHGSAACSDDSVVSARTVQVGDHSVQVAGLGQIIELAYRKGFRAGGALPQEILQAIYIYNGVPADEEDLYEQAALIAWETYCRSA